MDAPHILGFWRDTACINLMSALVSARRFSGSAAMNLSTLASVALVLFSAMRCLRPAIVARRQVSGSPVSVSFGGATPLDSGHSLFQYFGMVRVFLLAIVVLVMVTGVWLLATHHATYIYDVF